MDLIKMISKYLHRFILFWLCVLSPISNVYSATCDDCNIGRGVYLPDHPLLLPVLSSLYAPPGYGAGCGVLFGSINAVSGWPGASTADGNLIIGIGFGNGERIVGVNIYALIDSVGVRESFGKNSNVGVSLFRWFTPSTAIAIGSANLGGIGVFSRYSRSYYISGTQLFPLIISDNYLVPLAITVGAGSGAFVSATQFQSNRDNGITPFASVAFGVLPRANLILDYTTQIFSVGISYMPIRTVPIIITTYASNIGGKGWGENGRHGPITYGLSLSFGSSLTGRSTIRVPKPCVPGVGVPPSPGECNLPCPGECSPCDCLEPLVDGIWDPLIASRAASMTTSRAASMATSQAASMAR